MILGELHYQIHPSRGRIFLQDNQRVFGLISFQLNAIISDTFSKWIPFKKSTIEMPLLSWRTSCSRIVLRYCRLIDTRTPWSKGWIKGVTFGGTNLPITLPSAETSSSSSGWAEQLSSRSTALGSQPISLSFSSTVWTSLWWNHSVNKAALTHALQVGDHGSCSWSNVVFFLTFQSREWGAYSYQKLLSKHWLVHSLSESCIQLETF